MKTIYVAKLIKEASTKKRKPSFLHLVKTRHKELKKQQVDNYKKRGWTLL